MGAYAIFNYQFDKIIEHSRQYKLEGMDTVMMSAEKAFPMRQEIFGEMLEKDFAKATSDDIIHFKNRSQIPKGVSYFAIIIYSPNFTLTKAIICSGDFTYVN